ncbi:MAG TPA: DUF1428 domain-containing protein [Myxococcaceae bacterium]|nr:DUF1428 domain-containing protein [Myxococcaceae bacterium]
MSYIDAMVSAVPTANKDAYLKHVQRSAEVFKEYGALAVVEAWGDDVPKGKETDFLRAVKAQDDETVVLSWIIWKDRATRDVAWEKMMDEPRFKDVELPFDGKRLIYGGFNGILER